MGFKEGIELGLQIYGAQQQKKKLDVEMEREERMAKYAQLGYSVAKQNAESLSGLRKAQEEELAEVPIGPELGEITGLPPETTMAKKSREAMYNSLVKSATKEKDPIKTVLNEAIGLDPSSPEFKAALDKVQKMTVAKTAPKQDTTTTPFEVLISDKFTPEQKSIAKEAMIAGRRGGGVFRAITDDTGQIITFFNAKTRETVAPPFEGARTGGVPAGIQQKEMTLRGLLRDANEFLDIASKRPDIVSKFGPVKGWVKGLETRYASGDEDPDTILAFSLVGDLTDQRLRGRSGAQINEAEQARITRFSLSENFDPKTNIVNARKLKAEIEGMLRDLNSGSRGDVGPLNPNRQGGMNLDAIDAELKKRYGTR